MGEKKEIIYLPLHVSPCQLGEHEQLPLFRSQSVAHPSLQFLSQFIPKFLTTQLLQMPFSLEHRSAHL